MDKKDRANKRRQDKHHKKPPPSAAAAGKDKSSKKDQKPAAAPPSSAPFIVYDDPYSRRPIEPNWSRDRDLPPAAGLGDSSDEDDAQLHAADLEKLLQLPPSASGHFFLSTEKHWAEDQTAIVSGRHFRIDSKQLNLCLGTIPFHERNGYPAELFSKREIDSMALKASFETKKYQDYCQKQQAGKMSEPVPRVIPPPVKCLIGPDALPPGPEPPQEVVQPAPPPRPVPCLIGPMALPPELRHDPNVTGSYANAAPSAPVDVVPIEEEVVPVADQSSSSSKEKDQSQTVNATAQNDGATTSETKEDIQAWLDDILDA
ncbi:hypothetical protein pipiens_001468 [Culex pipiens pipiens]|uniref:Uncharacterized protein n=1 Tax=Culex pipiens pipiens TaxID=38569 RepID=A0ABD1CR35_CULPP